MIKNTLATSAQDCGTLDANMRRRFRPHFYDENNNEQIPEDGSELYLEYTYAYFNVLEEVESRFF